MAEKTLSVVDARRKFADVLGRVAYGREEIVIERAGQPMAVLINVEEYRRLKALAQAQQAVERAPHFKMIREVGQRNTLRDEEAFGLAQEATEEARYSSARMSMHQTLDALFDGEVLHPEEPVELEPNTRVRIVIETIEPFETKTPSFLRKARSLDLQGPPDWSARFEDYLFAEELYARAFQLYQQRPDKEWGITDCISFVVMQDRGIAKALTTDQHFQQAGFQVLLGEGP